MNVWQQIKTNLRGNFNMFAGITRSAWHDPDAWEASIRTFETHDRSCPPGGGMIIFVGSSSFTLWSTLEQDMAPLPVINRGFGGARMADVLHYLERILLPYQPVAVVLFVGTNDITWPHPAGAQQVYQGYLEFVRAVHARLPDTPIYYVGITPTPSRWRYWPIVQEANRLIRAHAQADSRLHFIDLTDQLLGPDSKPDRRLYRADGVHPSRAGYARWTAVIKPILEADLLRSESRT